MSRRNKPLTPLGLLGVGLFLSLFIVISATVILPLGRQQRAFADDLRARGRTVDGHITGYRWSGKHNTTLSLTYRYIVAGTEYKATSVVGGYLQSNYRIGLHLPVTYLPDDPQKSTVDVEATAVQGNSTFYAGVAFLVLPCFMFTLVLFMNKRLIRQQRGPV